MLRTFVLATMLVAGSVFPASTIAQQSIQHQPPTLIERGDTEQLEFRLMGISDDRVSEAILFSKRSSANSYSQSEVRVVNGMARAPLTITDREASDVEYYFEARLVDGQTVRYPNMDAGENPFLVNIVEPDTIEPEDLPSADFIDYTILAPTPGQSLSDEDLLIAIALFYDDEDVEDGEFRLVLNGQDVTDESEFTRFTVKYKPQYLSDGVQEVTVLFDREDTTYLVTSWNFRALIGEPVAFGVTEQPQRRSPGGNVELGARNQEISGINNDALTGRVRVSGREGDLEYSLSGYLTSQEDPRLQPQNRYSADIRYGNWLQFQAGDVYPYMSDMTINGRRVRGLHTKVSLFREGLEAQFLMGRMNRQIENLYTEILAETTQFGTTDYILGFEEGGRGMFQQNVVGGRLSFGRETSFRLAFQGLKIQDDTTSIGVIRDYRDVLGVNGELAANLSPSDRQFLQENPEELLIDGSNPRPRGNFVAGSELTFAMNDQRIRLRSEAAISLLNQDITEGFLTQERADELGIDLDQDIENLFDRLSWLIIINENMSTLPFRFSENAAGDLELDPFFPTAVLASDSRLNMNYFGHMLEVRYRWIGPDYQSLANSTVRRDVAGITITDRFRALQNRLYFTIGYETLNDNLLGERQATTNTTTYSGSVSWFPVRRNLPRVNFSTRFRVRDNDVARFNPSVPDQFLDAAVRNFRVENGQVVTAAAPRLRETLSLSSSISQSFNLLDLSHQAVVSFGITRTDDKLFAYGDNRSRNFSTRINTRLDTFDRPFTTRVGFNINRSESVSGLSNVDINGFDLGFETILVNGNLTLGSDLAFTRNRFDTLPLVVSEGATSAEAIFIPAPETERDLRETTAFIIRANAQYDLHLNHAIAATANITNLRVSLGEAGSIPNDRVLQLRYIFNF